MLVVIDSILCKNQCVQFCIVCLLFCILNISQKTVFISISTCAQKVIFKNRLSRAVHLNPICSFAWLLSSHHLFFLQLLALSLTLA